MLVIALLLTAVPAFTPNAVSGPQTKTAGTASAARVNEYLRARAAFEKAVDAYWDDIAGKRRIRIAKRRDKQDVTLDDYVLTQPPEYSGPPRPPGHAPPRKRPLDVRLPPIPRVADFSLIWSAAMPVVVHDNVPLDPFRSGATYQTLVGDEHGSTPLRIGIQTSSPGYRTPLHSHPYMEALTILEGEGVAWMEGGEPFAIAPGMTLVFPPNVRHWFRATGALPLKTCGVHASPHRIVIEHENDGTARL